jgi:hypothetical protein
MTSQYGAYALHTGLPKLHARMRMHTFTRTGTQMHSRTRARTHKPISNTFCFSTATTISERASVLSYTYIAPIVYFT